MKRGRADHLADGEPNDGDAGEQQQVASEDGTGEPVYRFSSASTDNDPLLPFFRTTSNAPFTLIDLKPVTSLTFIITLPLPPIVLFPHDEKDINKNNAEIKYK